MLKGRQHFRKLNHGDLIGFGEKNNMVIVYKFSSVSSTIEKKPRWVNNMKLK